MAREGLLPTNATSLEDAISTGLDRLPELLAGTAEMRAFKFDNPSDAILQHLIVEYGLGRIATYHPDFATVVAKGVPWQRLLGTPEAITQALSWIAYAHVLDEVPPRRRRWHLFHSEISKFWDLETDLNKIDDLIGLSIPVRSHFWRGYREYDVRPLEASYSRWGNALYGDSSGVRLKSDGAKWSFGRTHEQSEFILSQSVLTAAGVWIDPLGSLTWGSFPWNIPGISWSSPAADVRKALISHGLLQLGCWIGLHGDGGSIIGYRRARAYHSVVSAVPGDYQIAASGYDYTDEPGDLIYVEAMTGFGDGAGQEPERWSINVGTGNGDPNLPFGTQWTTALAPGGVQLANFLINPGTVLGQTSRERFRAVLKIT